jgi:uncharacterized protein (TIGR00369 family)
MAADRVHGLVSPEVLTAESGLSFLRGLIEGRHPAPPFSRSTNIYLTQAEEGRVVFTGTPGEGFFNPLGTIHGGWTSAILDSAMACAVHTTLRAGEGYTTVEMKLNFVRPILPELGEVACEGIVVHRGGTLATAEGKLFDRGGRLLAHGSETCLIFDAAARAAKAA